MPTFAYNRKAGFDYDILETYEAGLVLFGFEVKAIKTGHLSLMGAFVVTKGNELYLINAFIPPYQPKNTPGDYDPYRSRKLLLHRAEIASLTGKTRQKGLTLVPIKAYTRKGRIKLEFALAHGKKKFDKRAKIAERETKRKIDRAMKERN
jgi:SsrA-binding protein